MYKTSLSNIVVKTFTKEVQPGSKAAAAEDGLYGEALAVMDSWSLENVKNLRWN